MTKEKINDIIIKDIGNWAINGNTALILKTNKFFKSLGFGAVYCNKEINGELFKPCSKLTLVFRPIENYLSIASFGSNNRDAISSVYPNCAWSNPNMYYGGYTTYCSNAGTISMPIQTTTESKCKVNAVWGAYSKENNLVVMATRIKDFADFEKNEIECVFDILKEAVRTMGIKKVKINSLDRLVLGFKRKATERINNLKSEIASYTSNIKSYQSQMIECAKSINDSETTLTALLNLNKEKELRKGIKELKELKFVHNLRLDGGEITYIEKSVKIQYNNEIVDFGDFQVKITSSGVDFKGSKWVKNAGIYCHPHIADYKICFGTYGPKITELLVKLKLKELAILLHLCLQSYTPNDKYCDISYFIKAFALDGYETEPYEHGTLYKLIGSGEE